jgi:hypothetical protein
LEKLAAEEARKEADAAVQNEAEDVESINMSLDDSSQLTGADDFHADPGSVPNIWTLDPPSNDQTDDATADPSQNDSEEERAMDEPSFLKRLRNKRKQKSDKTDTND